MFSFFIFSCGLFFLRPFHTSIHWPSRLRRFGGVRTTLSWEISEHCTDALLYCNIFVRSEHSSSLGRGKQGVANIFLTWLANPLIWLLDPKWPPGIVGVGSPCPNLALVHDFTVQAAKWMPHRGGLVAKVTSRPSNKHVDVIARVQSFQTWREWKLYSIVRSWKKAALGDFQLSIKSIAKSYLLASAGHDQIPRVSFLSSHHTKAFGQLLPEVDSQPQFSSRRWLPL